jgi:hypothetical protein
VWEKASGGRKDWVGLSHSWPHDLTIEEHGALARGFMVIRQDALGFGTILTWCGSALTTSENGIAPNPGRHAT